MIQKVAFSSFDPSECSNYFMGNRKLKNLIKAVITSQHQYQIGIDSFYTLKKPCAFHRQLIYIHKQFGFMLS